jgi:uncharacterized membrane protein YjgN (DUF898 family)
MMVASPAALGAPTVRASFSGTGGEMFGKLFVGFLLTAITFGIYGPWFVADLQRYVYAKTSYGPTSRGDVRLEFTGTGGSLFVTGFVGGLLTAITLGIYYPWFLCNLLRYFTDNTVAVGGDGARYQLKFEGTGGEMFVTLLVGALLCAVTLGIYMPWFICALQRTILSKTTILENGAPAGAFDFTGSGGELFGEYLLGFFLTAITLGIYSSWFQVTIHRFMLKNTRATLNGRRFVGDFDATGGQLFGVTFVGGLLTALTLGIYYFWFLVNLIRFQSEHTIVREVA